MQKIMERKNQPLANYNSFDQAKPNSPRLITMLRKPDLLKLFRLEYSIYTGIMSFSVAGFFSMFIFFVRETEATQNAVEIYE